MDYLALLGCLALITAFALYIGYPLYARRDSDLLPSWSQAIPQHLVEGKEQLYASIKELEFDLTLGKLSTEDYQRLRAELEDQALAMIQQLDQVQDPTETATLHARIEADVQALDAHIEADVQELDTPVEADAQALDTPPKIEAYCGACGAKRRPADRFCPHCGVRFETAG
ncbi:MAG: hypothetical protein GKR89_12730 [Candidatus Latescibacteria bacterium]|nr:hypothetical protein [Candidatus Latescibacterota bacterium]